MLEFAKLFEAVVDYPLELRPDDARLAPLAISAKADLADDGIEGVAVHVVGELIPRTVGRYGEGRGARGVTGCKRPVFLTKKTLAWWGPSTPCITEPPVQPTQSLLSGRTSFRAW